MCTFHQEQSLYSYTVIDWHSEHKFKLLLIGNSSVGKVAGSSFHPMGLKCWLQSSLLMRFADKSFPNEYMNTIGIDYVRCLDRAHCPIQWLSWIAENSHHRSWGEKCETADGEKRVTYWWIISGRDTNVLSLTMSLYMIQTINTMARPSNDYDSMVITVGTSPALTHTRTWVWGVT